MTLVQLAGVVKEYGGLRPLRIEHLDLDPGSVTALVGIDGPSAEVLVSLLTGASLPDRGDVRILGRSTADIVDGTDWLSVVDQFGIVTPRAVFLDALSIVQNLAVPFSLDIEPPPAAIRDQAAALAREVGLAPEVWDRPLGEAGPAARVRVGLGRALALDPAVVLLEHPTAAVPRGEVPALAGDLRGVLERRGVAALALTADAEFARHGARQVLQFDPASGRLTEQRKRWFGR